MNPNNQPNMPKFTPLWGLIVIAVVIGYFVFA